jgi:energy-coupling factor transporter ATP-binding protein EcfA2
MIEIENLTYRYPLTDAPALQDVTLRVPRGQFCALVGPNGAGKSTLCYALSGYVPHFYRGALEGTIRVAGVDVPHTDLPYLVDKVGLVFQNPFNQISGARFTVWEEVAFGLENLGLPRDRILERVDEALALTGLTSVAGRSPYALSGGQQQRLALAAILAMQPQVLVLDEPTAQLDPMGTKEVFATLQRLAANDDMTIVLVSHKLEWVATFAERVIVLAGGWLVGDGEPLDVLTDPALIEAGIGQTRYSQAARQAGDGEKPLPVTLAQAVEYFDEYRR